MKERKFFLASKTILGLILIALATFLDLPEDMKKYLVGLGLALAGIGRWVADRPLTAKPGGKDEGGGPPPAFTP